MVVYSAVLVAVGSTDHKLSEVLEDGTWSWIEKPPIDKKAMSSYAVVFHGGHHYYFGGRGQFDGLKSVCRLQEKTWNWSKLGQLNSVRKDHSVISVEEKFIVIGGHSSPYAEECLLDNGEFRCTELQAWFFNYYISPILFLVDENYKNC